MVIDDYKKKRVVFFFRSIVLFFGISLTIFLLFLASTNFGMLENSTITANKPSLFAQLFFQLPGEIQAEIFSRAMPNKGALCRIKEYGKNIFKPIALSAYHLKINQQAKETTQKAGTIFNKWLDDRIHGLIDNQKNDHTRNKTIVLNLCKKELSIIEKELSENFLNPNGMHTVLNGMIEKKFMNTFINYAIKFGSFDCLTLLLTYGADPNQYSIRIDSKEPPLYFALELDADWKPHAEKLLEYGAHINGYYEECDIQYPLIFLPIKGDPLEQLNIQLLNRSPNPNRIEKLKFLLEHGADLYQTDSNGETAFDLVQKIGSREMIQLLEGYVKLPAKETDQQ